MNSDSQELFLYIRKNMKEIAKAYEASQFEDEIYKKWEESGVFSLTGDKSKKPFSIMMPPPNATGTLHLGHATMLALEDTMIRYKRMAGFDALWIPNRSCSYCYSKRC